MKTTVKVQFKGLTVNPKNERIATIVIKGDLKDSQILALDKLKGMGACFMDLYSSQTDIDDFSGHDNESEAEPHRGISYTVTGGEIKVDPHQLDMDEVIKDEETLVDVDYEVVDAVEFDKEGQEPEEGHEKQVDWLDDGYPSEDEKEIESMRSEAEDELSDELE